ncbi:MAG: ATP-binding cassette domain-containing protein [Treponema sp.]|nr:ATP-binding cassette domain-containing protein [Treponema sp.]
MDSQTIVNLENVRIQDTKETKIASLSWQMNAGEAWLVIGANGGGKADFLDGLAGTKQILRNKDNSIVNVFDGSAEVVSLERAARLIEEERELDESEYMDKIDEGRTGRRFICEVLGGPDARHRNLPLPAIADRLETLPEVKLCGIEKILDRGLKFMSTGEIRRTLLCRALLSKKKLLILSDPFAGLDIQSRTILLDFFKTIVRHHANGPTGTSVIMAMERYHEIPDTITNVLEFKNKEVSFCGTKNDYEKLLAERSKKEASEKEAKRLAFINDLKTIQIEYAKTTGKAPASGADADGTGSLIQMTDVNVGWDDHQVLHNFNWTVNPQEHWLIRGPNGSGKTTLLELITGDNHQVFCNDVRLFGRRRGTGESIWDIKKNLGIVSYRLHVEYRMVGGTDLEGVIISGFHDSIGLYEQKSDVERSLARKWLELGGFLDRANDNFNSLSYGEQRAILILRAAVKQPKILILDEPCHGLDENYRANILSLLETVASTGTTTLLHVTHDPTEQIAAEKHILELLPGQDPMYRVIEE